MSLVLNIRSTVRVKEAAFVSALLTMPSEYRKLTACAPSP
jgi:hypothetical protein